MSAAPTAPDLRLAMIGMDTSHCVEFTARLNQPEHPEYVPGARVVKALRSFSDDIPMSCDRVAGFESRVRHEFGVDLASSFEEVLQDIDGVLILTLDGRPHLSQVKAALAAGKPVFLDKPVAASLSDVFEVFRAADEAGVPLFSASALRWHPDVVRVAQKDAGEVLGAISCGPSHVLEHHPDLYFYGIHPTEVLFTFLGQGCQEVTFTKGKYSSVAVGRWHNGQLGTLHAIHEGAHVYRFTKLGRQLISEGLGGIDYTPLVRQLVTFFQTGIPPVSPEQTMEIYAFMEAANQSARNGGAAVELDEVCRAVTK
ncbi:MAG: Gfo/Idh/MocA family oxidoreductase [Verrucomicrobiaceae bacterium]|nr:Gfo/Idh/MocA family oxidoreductase [Verrucomicrobiaceae bacterium]